MKLLALGAFGELPAGCSERNVPLVSCWLSFFVPPPEGGRGVGQYGRGRGNSETRLHVGIAAPHHHFETGAPLGSGDTPADPVLLEAAPSYSRLRCSRVLEGAGGTGREVAWRVVNNWASATNTERGVPSSPPPRAPGAFSAAHRSSAVSLEAESYVRLKSTSLLPKGYRFL